MNKLKTSALDEFVCSQPDGSMRASQQTVWDKPNGEVAYATGTMIPGTLVETNNSVNVQNRVLRCWYSLFGSTARNGGMALMDQFVVSGTNFCTTVIVGRVCGAGELGVYALSFTLVTLITCAQEALVAMPYTVYCHRIKGSERARYAGSILMHHVLLAAIAMVSLILCGIGISVYPGGIRLAYLAWVLGMVVPFLLLRDLARRMAFAHLRMSASLILDIAVAALQIGGLGILAAAGALTVISAYIVMGVSCAISLSIWFVLARIAIAPGWRQARLDLRKNWSFGRWVFLALMALMLQISIVPWLLAAKLGTHAAGMYAACASIVLLANPFIQGISNLLMPRASQAFSLEGKFAVRRVVMKTTLILAVVIGLFCSMLFLLGDQVVVLLYNNEYIGCQAIITVLSLALLVRALGMPAYNGLRVMEHPGINLKANIVALVSTILGCLFLVTPWGILGAACGLLAGNIMGGVLRWGDFLRLLGKPSPEPSNA